MLSPSIDKSDEKKKVMICEDELELLDLYCKVLELNYDVVGVCSGKDCVEKFFEFKKNGIPIDLLLLDYRLGDMLGDDVAKKIRELNGLKIILISAYELDDQFKNQLVSNHYIDSFLKKPIGMKQMTKAISDMIS